MSSARRHDLDVLRVLATLLLIPFHTARVFDHEPWHVKNDVLTKSADIFVVFISNWHMPLFFLLAGAGIGYSLRRRSAGDFLSERIHRLFIPFIAGMAVVIPPQVYIERIGDSPARQSPINFEGSFFEFYPTFFTQGFYPEGNLSWHHLWFVFYLFLLSTLLLPVFLYLRGRGRRWAGQIANWFSHGRRIFLLALPLAAVRVALAGIFPGPQNIVHDGMNILTFATLLVIGYMIAAHPAMQTAIDRRRFASLAGALAGTAVIAALLLAYDWPPAYSGMYFAVHAAWAFTMWAWLLTFLGFAHRALNVDRPWIRSFGQIAYPFYIVHQTLIVLAAYYALPTPMGALAKFAAIAAVSLVLSWLAAEAIRRFKITRILFGVKAAGGSRQSQISVVNPR